MILVGYRGPLLSPTGPVVLLEAPTLDIRYISWRQSFPKITYLRGGELTLKFLTEFLVLFFSVVNQIYSIFVWYDYDGQRAQIDRKEWRDIYRYIQIYIPCAVYMGLGLNVIIGAQQPESHHFHRFECAIALKPY